MLFSSQQNDGSRVQKVMHSTSDAEIHIIEGDSIAIRSNLIPNLKVNFLCLLIERIAFGGLQQLIHRFLSDLL